MIVDGTETSSPKLLVVDDAPEIGFIVQRFGRRCGHQIVTCPDVPTAWDYLSQQQPDLLIVDVNLPGESGLVLCRRVRETAQLARLPMALFSHWERPGDIAAGLEAGSNYVISKSVLCRPEDWQLRIREIISFPDSRFSLHSLNWNADQQAQAVRGWNEALNQLLRYQVQRQVGTEVAVILTRRAGERMRAAFPSLGLSPDGMGLVLSQVTNARDAEMVLAFAVALANELWCLLGSMEGAGLFRSLAVAMPPLAETFTLK